MEITTYSCFRSNLKSFMDWVYDNSAPLYIKRTKGEDVVLLSKTEYESMQETLYLLRSPNNAKRLLEGLEEYSNGGGTARELIEK